MPFLAKEKVTGMQSITYDIDGQKTDVMCIFYEAKLDENRGGKGSRTVEKKCASRELVAILEKVNFPVMCEIELTETVTRNKADLVVTAIRPAQVQKAA